MTEVLFGLDVPSSAAPDADPVGQAAAAEALGFDFISTSDHPCGTAASYEVWTMLTWIAARTSRIRILTRVLGVPYRPPAMVAKMAETLHRLSGGRLILGLGGGASDDEFRAFGLGVPSAREKVDGLEEAIHIIQGLWSQPRFTFNGKRYHTDAADLEPKPDQPIPIWLGTFGNRALALTGRVADGWVPTLGYAPPAQLPAMRERVLASARAAGRAPARVTCALNLDVRITEGDRDDEVLVAGTPDVVADQLAGYVRSGFTAFNFKLPGPDPDHQVERLAREVIPAVRAAV
jgi:alkanesulfonate monooxygenase SsuD/methylene tetrahydromethanopterin reductase-like flavin-dependent oxidoreductase (luciferase family)